MAQEFGEAFAKSARKKAACTFEQPRFSICQVIPLLVIVLVAACSTHPMRNTGRVDDRALLHAEVSAAGVRRNRNADADSFHVASLANDSLVTLETSPSNWRLQTAKVLRISDGAVLREKAIQIHALNTGGADSVGAMQTFHGTRIAFGASNGEVVLWDLPSDQVRYLSTTLANRFVEKMEFAADGRLFVSDNRLQVWNTDTGTLLAEVPDVSTFALLPSGNFIVPREDGFDEISGKTYRPVRHEGFRFDKNPNGVFSSPVELAELPDGRVLEQGYTGDVRIWNFSKRRASRDISPDVWIKPTLRDGDGKLSNEWSLNATYHPDGYIIVESQDHRVVQTWDISNNRPQKVSDLPREEHAIGSFIPLDDHRVAIIYGDTDASIWDMRGPVLLQQFATSLNRRP